MHTLLIFLDGRAASLPRAAAGDTLRHILQGLRQQLIGNGATGEEQDALLQLQFYEAVMMLFEREAAPDGAVMFARAALQHLPAAYSALLAKVPGPNSSLAASTDKVSLAESSFVRIILQP